jgi:hypothetical protein
MHSMHKLTYTVVTWSTFWHAVLIGGPTLLPMFIYVSLHLLKDRPNTERVWKPVATAYGFYVFFFGFIPFHIIALTGTPENEVHLRSTATYEVTIDHQGSSPGKSITYEYYFMYDGIEFVENSYNATGNNVNVRTSVGWFGWENIDVITVY